MEKIGYIQPDSFIAMFCVCYGKGEDAKQLRSRPRDGDELGLYFTNNPGLRGIPLKIWWETHPFLSFWWCIFPIKMAILGS